MEEKSGKGGRRNTYRATSCQSFTILLPVRRSEDDFFLRPPSSFFRNEILVEMKRPRFRKKI